MKLIYCPICGDVVRLIESRWRLCACRVSGGQYNMDMTTATVGGHARVFGIGNPFFNELFQYLDDEGKARMRKDLYGRETDCWWGEWEGDVQIFRVESAEGPRVRLKVAPLSAAEVKLTVVDKRDYTVGRKKLKEVVVPRNHSPSFKRCRARQNSLG